MQSGGFAGSHGSDDGEAGEEALLREHQPVGIIRLDRLGGVMGFPDDERDGFIFIGSRPARQ